MGWSTTALVNVEFNRCTFNSKSDVQQFIDDHREQLERAKKTLTQLAFMTEPAKFCQDEDPSAWIQNQLEDALETIEYSGYWIGVARDVLNGWEYSHHENGLAYSLDYEDFDKLQRVGGDFVKICDAEGNPTDWTED